MKEDVQIREGLAMAVQAVLALTDDPDGVPYYTGPIDGQAGQKTLDAARRMLEEFVAREETPEAALQLPENAVLVFSLKEEGECRLSEHFLVREFACKDGSDPVFVSPRVLEFCELARSINGPFSPGSTYRNPSHNKAVGGAGQSMHLYGRAVDIPSKNATAKQLYDLFEESLGEHGGLGLYDWGIHVDDRKIKARWKG